VKSNVLIELKYEQKRAVVYPND